MFWYFAYHCHCHCQTRIWSPEYSSFFLLLATDPDRELDQRPRVRVKQILVMARAHAVNFAGTFFLFLNVHLGFTARLYWKLT